MNDVRTKETFYEFDDQNNEIVFKRHDMPSPWMNYLTNGEMFTMMSQAGGNLSWYKSPQIWRIGRYNFYNLPVDMNGLFVYIKDLSTGKTWNPTFIPCNEQPDTWRSAHGLGYTRFAAEKDGLKVSLTCFISKDNVLIYKMELCADTARQVQVFACQEMGLMQYLREVQWQCYVKNSNNILYNAEHDALVYEYFPDGQPRPDETPFVYFTSDTKSSSFSGSRQSFIGHYRDLKNPVAIERGDCGNTELKGGEAMFSLSFDLSLQAGKAEPMNIYLGTLQKDEDLGTVLVKVKGNGYATNAFSWLKNYWETRLSRFRVEIPDQDSARMMNVWNPLQALVNFYVCREISFYATGTVRGVGVRDASQDILGNVLYDLPAAKKKLKLIMTQQYNCGKTVHYFYPEERAPALISDRSDNHLWMIYTAYQIVMEEGNTDFLFETVEYYDGGSGTVFEHLKKSIEFTVNNLGVDGLPLMLGSDWNDMLSNVCKDGKGESVFVSQMLVLACKQMIELCALVGENHPEYIEIIKKQEGILNDFCWDGEWFIRAVTDEGMKLGKKGDACAELWINSQSWAVFSESTTKDRGMSAMNAAMERLDCGYGLMKLYPPLQRNYPSKENELTFAQPGIGENGGVFCHANTWAIIAQCMLGNGEQAYKIYQDMIPDHIVSKFGVDLYNAEPYIYSSNIRAPMALSAGAAGVSWLSGTAAWMTIAVQQYMFGLKPKMDGLEIKPCVPNAWKTAKVQRVFRGCTYDITIENPCACGNTVKEIYVNGEKVCGNVIAPQGERLTVTVVMGK
ncbi:MAG: hypothetical protein J6C79_02980 [Clostridia bacterium]|nr:hypothetical protein [Clostridia bacterium]